MTTSAMSIYQIHAHSLLASTFSHPREVLAAPLLDTLQKRCVLAAWASDVFAVEGKPWLRQLPGSGNQIRIGDILAALRQLDGDDPPPRAPSALRPIKLKPRTRAIGQTALEQRRRQLWGVTG